MFHELGEQYKRHESSLLRNHCMVDSNNICHQLPSCITDNMISSLYMGLTDKFRVNYNSSQMVLRCTDNIEESTRLPVLCLKGMNCEYSLKFIPVNERYLHFFKLQPIVKGVDMSSVPSDELIGEELHDEFRKLVSYWLGVTSDKIVTTCASDYTQINKFCDSTSKNKCFFFVTGQKEYSCYIQIANVKKEVESIYVGSIKILL